MHTMAASGRKKKNGLAPLIMMENKRYNARHSVEASVDIHNTQNTVAIVLVHRPAQEQAQN